MNALFGDATSQMPTPASQPTRASHIDDSPIPSLALGQHGPDAAIPGLDIDPPSVEVRDGRPMLPRQSSGRSEIGVGGWISNMLRRGSRPGEGSDAKSGAYRPLDQDDD